MPSRTPYVAANWKMHKTVAEAAEFVDALLPQIAATQSDVVICPPFTALSAVVERRYGTAVKVAAQNMHEEDSGAYTGEVSAAMLAEFGCRFVIVGHSERRTLFGESNEAVARKYAAALKAGLTPILCIGETLVQREAGSTEETVAAQLGTVLESCGPQSFTHAVIAYEPVWAIGTGKTATPEQAQAVHAFIRGRLAAQDEAVAANVQVIYGGSVKGANAAQLFAMPDIDGGLIGGASLDAQEFSTICQAASPAG